VASQHLAVALSSALVGLLPGCAAEPVLMPTPAVLRDARLGFTDSRPVALRSTRLPVFYGTTRAAAAPEEHGHYVNRRGRAMVLGVADVRLGEPGWTWEELIASDRASSAEEMRPGEVERVVGFGAGPEAERRFVAALDSQLATVRNQEIVLYVHGYRVSFDEVAVQMGSFAHYLNHGTMVTFQWPTGHHFWNYVSDCPRAERYVRAERYIADIERLIALLAESSAAHINLLAYSCGSPLLGAALARLRARHPAEGRAELAQRYRIGNVILAASDVDLKTFASEHVPPILDLAQQLIVYVSRNDRALGISGLVAGGSRLGKPDIAELSPRELERLGADPRLQVIDVSEVRGAHEMGGMKGHGYWYANDWVSTDIVLSLRHPIPAASRCLVSRPHSPRVWHMPHDYVECVADRLLGAFPELRRMP
jgi:esterase/lipase superfamily enzyme